MQSQMKTSRWCLTGWMLAVGWMFMVSVPVMGWGKTELPKEVVLPLFLAQKAANAALAKCEEGGYRVSVAVVGRKGMSK